MNKYLNLLLRNIVGLLIVPALAWYLTYGGTVDVVADGEGPRRGRAVAWLVNEFGTNGIWMAFGFVWLIILVQAVKHYRLWQKEKQQQ